MAFCKTRQVEGLWIAWSKRSGSFVKMMSKNSISALTNRSRLGSDDFCWTKFLILGANQRYQRLLSPSQLWLWIGVRTAQKPNSWTYNFVEVSGHNLDSSQTWGLRVTMFTLQTSFKPLFLGVILKVLRLEVSALQYLHYKPVSNHFFSGGGGGDRSRIRQSVQVIVNSKEENPEDFCLNYSQEFGLWSVLISLVVACPPPYTLSHSSLGCYIPSYQHCCLLFTFSFWVNCFTFVHYS